MKVIKIDVEKKSIYEVEYNGTLESLYELIGCTVVDRFYIDNNCIYIDDEGFFNNDRLNFVVEGGNKYVGNAVVVGTDHEGKDISPTISIDKLNELITFIPTIYTKKTNTELAELLEKRPFISFTKDEKIIDITESSERGWYLKVFNVEDIIKADFLIDGDFNEKYEVDGGHCTGSALNAITFFD